MRTILAIACALPLLAACATKQHVYAVKETTQADAIDFLGWKGLRLPPNERWTVVQYSDASQSLHRQTPGPHLEVSPSTADHAEGCAGELRRRYADAKRSPVVEHEPYYVPAFYAQDARGRCSSGERRPRGARNAACCSAPSDESRRARARALPGCAGPGHRAYTARP